MPTEAKKQTVEALESEARACTGLVVTTYKGLKTTEFNEFRQKLRPLKSEYRVVKNSLTRMALKNAGMSGLAEAIQGPSALVIEDGDPLAALKTVFEFAKTHENIKVQAGYLDGKLLSGSKLKEIAALPPREVLLSHLLGTFKAPLVNLLGVFQAPVRDLVQVLDAIVRLPAK